MDFGWFRIPGVQGGARTLEEQMLGVSEVLREANNKTVLDLGCAEALIAIEFKAAGAKLVYGCDCNQAILEAAERMVRQKNQFVWLERLNLNDRIDAGATVGELAQYDIVLALAILHKMRDPQKATEWAAARAKSLLVLRLPKGTTNVIASKHYPERTCNVKLTLERAGMRLTKQVPGAKGELVQQWRR